ncbi:MAG: D-alanyl-D-alanine endopeptidase [Betaproteobacteria bacterium]|nr:D-alanyl-D-alanine endopeptidase [Betaproteobacteria bacterium]
MNCWRLLMLVLVALPMLLAAPAEAGSGGRKQADKSAKTIKASVKPGARAGAAAASEVKRRHGRKQIVSPRAVTFEDVEEGGDLILRSASAMVLDQSSGATIFEKNSDAVVPIASITKLMTAMVVLDGRQPLDQMLSIGEDDKDGLRGTRSRLRVGAELRREDLLRLALMASENRAAAALARHYPGGLLTFVATMNAKARELGLTDTHFDDSTGLSATNVSSARDLVRMVSAAARYPLIREWSTATSHVVEVAGREMAFNNTNALVRNPSWEIGVSKTGFINESGKCLVMQAWFNNRPVIIVLLDSAGRLTRVGDAMRIKKWVEHVVMNRQQLDGHG